MRYEIINPSDKCYITAENDKVADYCTLILGEGMYGCKDENGNQVGYLRLFGVTEKSLNEDFDGDFKKFAKVHKKEIADCFASFEYAGEATSLNNIASRAKQLADIYKE